MPSGQSEVALPRTLLASLAIVGFMGASWLASAEPSAANHAWGNYHWARTSNPFALKVIDSTTPAWDSYRTAAQADWSSSTAFDLVGDTGKADDSSRTRQRCRVQTGEVRVCNYTYGQTGWLGIASIWISGDHITGGTVKNNDTYFNMQSYNTPAWRQFVVCQEIGHTFGLAHQDENFSNANLGSCMDYTNNPSTNQHPNQHDYAQLESIYGHLDGSTTLASGTTSGGRGRFGLGAADGALADDATDAEDALPAGATAAMGHHFTRDLGNGQRIETFVLWASEVPGDAPQGKRPAR